MLFCGAAVLLCCLWMVLHMLTAVAQHEHFVHLIIDAILLLAIAAFLIVFGIIKLQRTDKYNKSINLYGMPAAEVNRSLGIRATNLISNIGIHTLLIIMSIVWLIPFACIILQSFRCETAMPVGYVIPKQWGFDNYAALLKTDFPKWYLNTFIMALAVAVLQTIIVLCMSYVLSRFRFKLRKPLMSFMLILGMFPGMLTMIILYRVLKDLGLTQANAVPGLILVYVASSGMGYYVSKGFFDTLPKSLDEAACMDGATRAQVLFKIILPLAKPIVIYTVLTAFMGPWGDFVFARYISMNTSAGMNVAVGLNSWLSLDQINTHYTWFCAGGVIVAMLQKAQHHEVARCRAVDEKEPVPRSQRFRAQSFRFQNGAGRRMQIVRAVHFRYVKRRKRSLMSGHMEPRRALLRVSLYCVVKRELPHCSANIPLTYPLYSSEGVK